MHALIIEDEPIVAMSIEMDLAELGYTSCDIAASEAEAVAAADRHPPDLITSDMRIAAGDGVSAVRAILRTQSVPVVFITASADEVRKAIPSPMIVEKPLLRHRLIEAIRGARAAVEALGSRPTPVPTLA